jgi:hypothetical protein
MARGGPLTPARHSQRSLLLFPYVLEPEGPPEATRHRMPGTGAAVGLLDGTDGAQAPALRQGGTAKMLDGIARYLTAQPAS